MKIKITDTSGDISRFSSVIAKQRLKTMICAIDDSEIQSCLLRIYNTGDYNLLLRNAVSLQHLPIIQFLLMMPVVNVNSRGTKGGETALHIAARKGLLDIARLLIENSAFVNAVDKQCVNPLLAALRTNQFVVAEYLVDNGAILRLPSASDMPDIKMEDIPQPERAQFSRLTMKINRDLKTARQHPSIEKTAYYQLILGDAFIIKYCEGSLYRNIEITEEKAIATVLDFFRTNKIAILTRKELMKLETQYQDMPYEIVTEIFAKQLISEESLYFPFTFEEYVHIVTLINTANSLKENQNGKINLTVSVNNIAARAQKTTSLRWQLTIATSLAPAEEISSLTKKMAGGYSSQSDTKTIYFSKVTADVVIALQDFQLKFSKNFAGPECSLK